MGAGRSDDLPFDQRIDDGNSLVIDSEPLDQPIELLGAPKLILEIASDKPIAQICARLCDVAPDGSSRRVSYQVLNLTHRNSHEHPEKLEPGTFYRVELTLNDCGYIFDKNHRVRIALSSVYWPLVWPAPELATLQIKTQECSLGLPVRMSQQEDVSVRFDKPVVNHRCPITTLSPRKIERYGNLDLLSGKATYVTDEKGEKFILDDIQTMLSHDVRRELSIDVYDPLSASQIVTQKLS